MTKSISGRKKKANPSHTIIPDPVLIDIPERMINMRQDVTKQRQAENALPESGDQYLAILDCMGDAIHVVDQDLRVLFFNKEFLDWNQKLNLTTDIIGKDIYQIFPFLSKNLREEYSQTFRTGETLVTEEFTQLQGQVIHTETRKIPVFKEGKVIRVITVICNITKRKLAEERLLESEVHYRTLFESANDAIFIIKSDVIFDCNAQTLEMFNCTREQIIGKTPYFVSPKTQYDGRKSKEITQEKINLVLQGQPQRFEWQHIRRDGVLFDAEVSLNRLDLSGQAFVLAIVRDITLRRRAENALRESESQYRNLIEQATDAIYLANAEGTFILANTKFCEMLRYAPDEILQLNILDTYFTEDMDDFHKRIERVQSGESIRFERRVKRKDGTVFLVEASARKLEEGKLQVILRDITERKGVEETLRLLGERYRNIYNNTPAMLHSINREGRLISVSDYWLETMGYDRNDVIGRFSTDFLTDSSREYAQSVVLPEFYKTGFCKNIPYKFVKKNGEVIDVLLSAIGERDDTGAVVQSLAVITDITERKRAEEFLVALNQTALAVEKALTPEEIFLAVANEFNKLGLPCMLFPVDENLNKLVTRYMSFDPEVLKSIEKLVKIRHDDFTIPLDQVDIFSRAVRERKTIFDNNVVKISSQSLPGPIGKLGKYIVKRLKVQKIIVSPLIVDDKVIGIFSVQSDNLLEMDVPAIAAFASQISAVWRKAQLFERAQQEIVERMQAENDARRRADELETLARISTSMRVAQNRLEIFSIILQQVSVLFKTQGTAIAMKDPNTNESIIELGSQDWENWTNVHVPPGEGISGLVIDTGQPYQNNNALDDPVSISPDLFHDLTAVACVPLIANEQTIGALWVGRLEPIDDSVMRLLTAIGNMTANAIYRQSLHEDLKIQLEELHQTQDRLVQSEKLAAIGQFVSGVAHELNNPLTSVVLNSQLINQEELGEEARGNLGKVISEALRAGKIVRDLLDFARQRPLNRELVQVNDIVKTSLDLVSYELRAHNIKLETHLSENLSTVIADQHQLQQVLVNVVQNARQAMNAAHGHGHLIITTEDGPSNYVAQEIDKRRMVRICVQDDGPGIPENIMVQIFDPFFTTKLDGSGTGLGLSICHGIVSEHGGHIWAESKVGEGAKVFIELPVSLGRENKKITRVVDKEDYSLNLESRVLILDDEPNIQDVLAQALRRRGYTVDTASNAADGMLRIGKMKYDVILCDIRMPEFSGLEFYRRVQVWQPELAKRIIFITGDTANKATQTFIEENNVQYLSKPFELMDLLQVIRHANDKQVN